MIAEPAAGAPAIESGFVMSPEAPAADRPFSPDDPALRPGWALLEFLLSIGADEISLRFLYAGNEGKAPCDDLLGRLSFALLGDRTRECTVTYANESNPRPIRVWRFDRQSLKALRDVLPDGVLDSGSFTRLAWAEDLCVYRAGELLFGAVTHEGYAFLRLPEAEWRQWNATAER
jgi:hypothetical protein